MADFINRALKIRDAIRNCHNDDSYEYCDEICPYRMDGCRTAMILDAADMIDVLVECILSTDLKGENNE